MNSMDGRIRPLQLDLFASSEIEEPRRNGFYNQLASRVNLSLETAIILFIFLVLSFLLVFSFGVERGKYLARLEVMPQVSKVAVEPIEPKTTVKVDAKRIAVSQVKTDFTPAKVVIKTTTPLKVVSLGSQPAGRGRYTVQIASFAKIASAKKEAEGLRGLGYQTSLRSSGEFHSLCVGSYTDKQEAEIAMKKLRSKYHDCFIRRL